MGYDGINSGALLKETFDILKLASGVETLEELKGETYKQLPYKSKKAKSKYFNVIKDRFLHVTEDGRIVKTPLLKLINLSHVEDRIKREVLFYHLSKAESLNLQILYYLYNFLPQKKEISKSNFKSSAYLLMDKESSSMLKNLLEVLESFGLININKKQNIEFDYYSVSWQAFIYALYHHYKDSRDKKKVSLSMTDVFESALPRIFLVNLQHMQKILSDAEDFWLIRPAGKGFQNNFLLVSSLDRIVEAF